MVETFRVADVSGIILHKNYTFSLVFMKDFNLNIAFTLGTFSCYFFILFNYYYISFHRDNSKLNKNGIHVAANREFKELSVDLEWIAYFKSSSKYGVKDNLLLIKTASKNKI